MSEFGSYANAQFFTGRDFVGQEMVEEFECGEFALRGFS
jgi:hypothetical protein